MALCGQSFAKFKKSPSTFQIEISLISSRIHAGENLTIMVVVSNPTNNIVWTGSAIGLEILNNKGADVATQAMGLEKHPNSGFVLDAKRAGIRPNSKYAFRLQPRLKPGSLAPGIYKVRVYEIDAESNARVYSNAVKLKILP